MVWRRVLSLVLVALVLGFLLVPAGAGAEGMSDAYPREIATTSTGEGVRLTRLEASVRRAGNRAQVTVRLAGASTAGTRRLAITVAACTVTSKPYKNAYDAPDAPSRPTCRTGETTRAVTVTEAPFSVVRVFTIPRPASRPGALRVRVRRTAGSAAVPACHGYREICGVKDTGDLLLNGNTWRFRPATWWGIVAQPPAGVTLDRIIFRSRSGGWVVTSPTAARILTTWGYLGEPAAKSQTTAVAAGVPKVLRRNSTFGGEFQTRPTIRVLEYTAAIAGQRLFAVKLPLPVWGP